MPRPMFFVGRPSYNGWYWMGSEQAMGMASLKGKKIRVQRIASSLLPAQFNQLWCNARNAGADYFAMLHADIGAPGGWLDVLHDEMQAHGAHIISAVVALKCENGTTSTAIDRHGVYSQHQRLTVGEIAKLPETFSAADLPDGGTLLINTGMMLWDLRAPESDKFPGFHFLDRVGYVEDGAGNKKWLTVCEPEDWELSRWAASVGLKVMATRKIQTRHEGPKQYTTAAEDYPFALETDSAYAAADKSRDAELAETARSL